MAPVLRVNNLSVDFNGEAILKDISFTVEAGEIVSILGPNGAGKTTLLKALMGIIPYQGKVEWAEKQRLSYVPQRLEVNSNFPIQLQEFFNYFTPQPDQKLLEFFGLTDILTKPIKEISVGQLQRFLIAFAFLRQPTVLLFDEPTTGLDISGEESVYQKIRELGTSKQLTTIMVSHDLSVVFKFSTKVICLNKSMLCIGAPADISDETIRNLYHYEVALYPHQH
jgi:zinc transport system ATP-binding protein